MCFYFFFLFLFLFFFFFNDTATTEIYTLSLHDALPILNSLMTAEAVEACMKKFYADSTFVRVFPAGDRKSTRLNSSHSSISYAVFCLKKKKKTTIQIKLKKKITQYKYN